ncbi:MAG: zinc transporter ZupT [Thermoplasmata archaeon]
MDLSNVYLALGLTLLAGLSTGIGSAIAYFIKKPKLSYLSFSLGLSAGVMVYISFVELLPSAIGTVGEFWGVTSFFIGILFIAIIDLIIPEAENPHEFKQISDSDGVVKNGTLLRASVFTAVAIAIHNFPEGLVTFSTALSDINLGIVIAIAIAIHNIPEGISVSVPFFYSTGDRKKSFLYSFLSGLSEPLGAVISFLILMPFLTPAILALLLSFVAGIMIYISLDELLPLAHRYGHNHVVILGVVFGMLIMAISLLFL